MNYCLTYLTGFLVGKQNAPHIEIHFVKYNSGATNSAATTLTTGNLIHNNLFVKTGAFTCYNQTCLTLIKSEELQEIWFYV